MNGRNPSHTTKSRGIVLLVLALFLSVLAVGTPRPAHADVSVPFTSTEDAYVDASRPTRNYGSESNMRIDGKPVRIGYLLFDVQGAGVPSGATLRLFTETPNGAGFDVYEVLDTTWNEDSLVYDNAPPLGPLLGSTGVIPGGTFASVDVSAAVAGDGLVAFAITTTDSSAIDISTKEGSNAPELWIPAPPSASPYVVSHDGGDVYRAVSQPLGTTFVDTLKNVVERAVGDLESSGGGEVIFQTGTFDLGSDHFEFESVDDIIFTGQGIDVTILRNSTDDSTDTEPFDFTDSKRVTVRDMTVSAGGAPRPTSDALDFDEGDDILVERVKVTASRGRGIVFDGKDLLDTGTANRNTVRDCVVTGVPGDGIELLASNQNLIEGCVITDVGGHGIQINKASTVADQPNKQSNDNTIRANTIDNAGRDGINVNSGDRNVIVDNVITNSSDDTSGRSGIRIDSADSQTCDDNIVDANVSTDNQATKTQKYGLDIADSMCNRTIVSDNTLTGNLIGDFHDLGTDTQVTSSDTESPTTPTNVRTGTVTWEQVDLAWDASTDNVAVATYTIVRDGSPIATVDGATLTYQDTDIQPSTTYLYQVSASDAADNVSAASSPALQVDTPALPSAFTLTPVADAYVHASFPTTNYGSSSQIRVDASPDLRGYLRFDVPGGSGTITSASLRIYANSGSSIGFDVSGVENNTWSELTLTDTTAPAFGATVGATGTFSGGTWQEIDVTSLVAANAEVSFGISTTHTTAISLASRESANPPQLVISTGSGGAPVAGDVSVTTDEDTATAWVPVVSDPDGDTLSCVIVDPASSGSATVTPDCSSGTYTPDPDATGTDTFAYQVGDGAFVDTGTVTVTVTPVNDAPEAVAVTAAVTQDQALTITLTGSDIDGDCPLGFSVDTAPANGTLGAVTNLTCVDGSASADVLYTPNSGYTGSDSFTFVVDDPSGASSTPADVTLTVDPVQTAFTFATTADAYVDASKPDTNYGTRTSLRIDASPERRSYFAFNVQGLTGPVTSATLRIYTNSSSSLGHDVSATPSSWDESTLTFANAPAIGALLGSSGGFSRATWVDIDVTATISSNGDYSFVVTTPSNTAISLASRESANPPQLVISTGSGGPPVAGDVSVTTDEDTATAWVPVVSDPDGDTLSCVIVDPASSGSATVTPDCSSGTYTPDPDATGTDTFAYQVGDGAFVDTGTVTVTVTPVNDAPEAVAVTAAVTQDQALTITLTGSDIDGDCPLGFSVDTAPANGTLGAVTNLTCVDGSASADVLYTPNSGYTGSDSFTFVVDDPSGASSTPADVTLTVDPVQTAFTFATTADAYVDASKPDTNYGTRTSLRIDASPERRSYFAFNVQGLTGPVTSATLRIYTNSSSSLGHDVSATPSSWDESTLTFANAPAIGALLGSSGGFSRATWVDIDVTATISSNGDYSFVVTTPSNTAISLASRESANPPQLVISTGSGG